MACRAANEAAVAFASMWMTERGRSACGTVLKRRLTALMLHALLRVGLTPSALAESEQ